MVAKCDRMGYTLPTLAPFVFGFAFDDARRYQAPALVAGQCSEKRISVQGEVVFRSILPVSSSIVTSTRFHRHRHRREKVTCGSVGPANAMAIARLIALGVASTGAAVSFVATGCGIASDHHRHSEQGYQPRAPDDRDQRKAVAI